MSFCNLPHHPGKQCPNCGHKEPGSFIDLDITNRALRETDRLRIENERLKGDLDHMKGVADALSGELEDFRAERPDNKKALKEIKEEIAKPSNYGKVAKILEIANKALEVDDE